MELKYTKTHEWVKFTDDTTAYVGITDHAQKELGDLVFVGLPVVGTTLEPEQAFADVESVKAVSEIYSPIAGSVTEINEELNDRPELINETPYDAWLVKVEGIGETVNLLTEDEYNKFLDEE